MSAAEWDATPWHDQMAYLEGLDEDREVPFGLLEDEVLEGVQHRTGVDAGTDVIDLSKMKTELEAGRAAKRGGG
jgi:hypothetical protein